MRLLSRIALLALSVCVSIIILEIGVRLIPFLPITSMGAVMRRDDILDHSLRPHSRGRMISREFDVTYEINSVGLRDDEPEQNAVMILGDSFMEGYGIERSKALPDILRDKGIRIINAGVKSYSPLLEYLYLVHRGLKLNPDTVVLFYDLSDPANDAYYTERLVLDENGMPHSITPQKTGLEIPRNGVTEWFDSHSVLYHHIVHLLRKRFPGENADRGYSGASVADQLLFAARDSEPDTTYYPRWSTSLGYLLLIRDLLQNEKIEFVLVTYPYGHQVSADAWAEGRLAHRFPPGVSSDRPFRFLERWAAANGITLISLDRAFRNHPDPGSLYFTFDGHWTPDGHRLAAESLYARLWGKAITLP